MAFLISNADVKGVELKDLPTPELRIQVDRWLKILGQLRTRGPGSDGVHAEMVQMLEAWYATVFEPVRALLPAHVRRIVFVPHLFFHLIPMHALCKQHCGTVRYLIDEFEEISYAPSMSIFARCTERPLRDVSTLVAVQNPTGDLPRSESEVEAISKLFPKSLTIGTGTSTPATAEVLIQKARFADVFLFAGHSTGGDLEQAALFLGDGRMRASDLLTKLYLNNCSL